MPAKGRAFAKLSRLISGLRRVAKPTLYTCVTQTFQVQIIPNLFIGGWQARAGLRRLQSPHKPRWKWYPNVPWSWPIEPFWAASSYCRLHKSVKGAIFFARAVPSRQPGSKPVMSQRQRFEDPVSPGVTRPAAVPAAPHLSPVYFSVHAFLIGWAKGAS